MKRKRTDSDKSDQRKKRQKKSSSSGEDGQENSVSDADRLGTFRSTQDSQYFRVSKTEYFWLDNKAPLTPNWVNDNAFWVDIYCELSGVKKVHQFFFYFDTTQMTWNEVVHPPEVSKSSIYFPSENKDGKKRISSYKHTWTDRKYNFWIHNDTGYFYYFKRMDGSDRQEEFYEIFGGNTSNEYKMYKAM